MAESPAGQTPKEAGEAQSPEAPSVPEKEEDARNRQPEQKGKPAKQTAPRSASSIFLRLILFALIIGVPLGWFLIPEGTRQSWTGMLTGHPSQQNPGKAEPSSAPLPSSTSRATPPTPVRPPAPLASLPGKSLTEKSVAEKSAAAPSTEPQHHPAAPRAAEPPQPSASRKPAPHPAATTEEVRALMTAMDSLRDDMKTLRNTQAGLRREMQVRQQLELRDHLRMIASPESRLPQMASLWRDIALLPILSADERAETKSMWKLAGANAKKLADWINRLKQLAGSLPEAGHKDMIPKPRNPAFSWLTGKFHLRPAPTLEQRELSALRQRLLTTAHALTVEIWPEHKVWRHLLTDLREHFGDDADLGLPERLDGTRKDAASMRAKAADWLENQ